MIVLVGILVFLCLGLAWSAGYWHGKALGDGTQTVTIVNHVQTPYEYTAMTVDYVPPGYGMAVTGPARIERLPRSVHEATYGPSPRIERIYD